MQRCCGDLTHSKMKIKYRTSAIKKISRPKIKKKMHSKVAHNPTRPTGFSPASFFFVKLRQF